MQWWTGTGKDESVIYSMLSDFQTRLVLGIVVGWLSINIKYPHKLSLNIEA